MCGRSLRGFKEQADAGNEFENDHFHLIFVYLRHFYYKLKSWLPSFFLANHLSI